jgi:hypothetical protein
LSNAWGGLGNPDGDRDPEGREPGASGRDGTRIPSKKASRVPGFKEEQAKIRATFWAITALFSFRHPLLFFPRLIASIPTVVTLCLFALGISARHHARCYQLAGLVCRGVLHPGGHGETNGVGGESG